MGAPFWSDIEHNYFVDTILPLSRYPRGSYQEVGLAFDELAPMMQFAMDERGASRRQYTGAVLFQHWYQKVSPRSNVRGEAITQSPIVRRDSWQRDGQSFTDGAGRSRTNSQPSSVPDPYQASQQDHRRTSANHLFPSAIHNSHEEQSSVDYLVLRSPSSSTPKSRRYPAFKAINDPDSPLKAATMQTTLSPSTPKSSSKKRILEDLFGEDNDEGILLPAAHHGMSSQHSAKKPKGDFSSEQDSISNTEPKVPDALKQLQIYGSPSNPSRLPSQSTLAPPSPSVSPMTQPMTQPVKPRITSTLNSHFSFGQTLNTLQRGTPLTRPPSQQSQQLPTQQEPGVSSPRSKYSQLPTAHTSGGPSNLQECSTYSQAGSSSSVSSSPVPPRRSPVIQQSPPCFPSTTDLGVGSQDPVSTGRSSSPSRFREFYATDITTPFLSNDRGSQPAQPHCSSIMGAYAPLTPEAPLQAKSASHIKNGPAPSQATSQTLNYTPASTTVTNITPTNTKPTNALSSAPIPGSSNITPFSPGAADRASENNPEKNRKPKLGAIWRVEKVMVPECPSCGRGFGYEDGE